MKRSVMNCYIREHIRNQCAAPFLRKKLQLGLEKPSCCVKYKYATTYYFTQELYFEWDLYSTVINHRVIDSQSTESVLVCLREVDFLYSLIRSGLISKLWWAFSRKSSRLIRLFMVFCWILKRRGTQQLPRMIKTKENGLLHLQKKETFCSFSIRETL